MGMKGHPESNNNGGGGGEELKMKKIAVVVAVVMVAVMGFMVVHKLKDRRLFNLLIKDKDRQILSLHLLLQKERQYAKETKRKNQELNAKLYSIRTEKTELDYKISEMRSTITSLRDEQRTLESAYDEKQNEIKQKETEIQALRAIAGAKAGVHFPAKIWSVSTDDPSNPKVNLTDKRTQADVGVNGEGNSQKRGVNPYTEIQNPREEVRTGVDFRNGSNIETKNTTYMSMPMKGKVNDEIGSQLMSGKSNQAWTREVDPTVDMGGDVPERENSREAEADVEDNHDMSIDSSRGSEADEDNKEELEE